MVEAEATLCLANVELRLFGRFARALDFAHASVRGFKRCGGISGECRARATLANAAARLGQYEYAMETALLAARLAHWKGLAWEQLLAYRSVGFVAFHGRHLEEARNAYQHALLLAPHCDPPANPFEIYLGLAAVETARYVTARSFIGSEALEAILDALERHLGECQHWSQATQGDISLTPGSHPTNLLMFTIAKAQLEVWRHRLPEAYESSARMHGQLTQPWQAALIRWLEAELALAEGRTLEAINAAIEMAAVAQVYEHASLASISFKLLSYFHHVHGDHLAAQLALQQWMQRELAARAKSLQTRLETVDRRFEQRIEQMRLQRAEMDSRLFEKLAMEDPLTGLANRRHLERVLSGHLTAGTMPLCMALIDVDRFKQVNDTHSHNVGDTVLQAIARILTNELREDSLAARLGGDEFVVVLSGTSLEAALDTVGRIDLAVRRHLWSELAPGLQVSVSIGAAEAQSGDTMALLVQRCDEQMYAVKRVRRRDVQ